MKTDLKDKTILFYDGECALCNFWVQFCLERDRKKVIFYAPLQGDTAAYLLPPELREKTETVVFWQDYQLQIKSTAILAVLQKIGYAPDLLFIARLLPKSFLDKIYDFIASRRYRWFGKKEQCPIPSEDQRGQLLG